MIIKDLETMEKIVAKNKSLSWTGWDVVELKRSDLAKTSVAGVRVNGQWYMQNIFSPDRNGWDIPNKYRL